MGGFAALLFDDEGEYENGAEFEFDEEDFLTDDGEPFDFAAVGDGYSFESDWDDDDDEVDGTVASVSRKGSMRADERPSLNLEAKPAKKSAGEGVSKSRGNAGAAGKKSGGSGKNAAGKNAAGKGGSGKNGSGKSGKASYGKNTPKKGGKRRG